MHVGQYGFEGLLIISEYIQFESMDYFNVNLNFKISRLNADLLFSLVISYTCRSRSKFYIEIVIHGQCMACKISQGWIPGDGSQWKAGKD